MSDRVCARVFTKLGCCTAPRVAQKRKSAWMRELSKADCLFVKRLYRYGKTWADFEVTPQAQSWRMLRALRQHPPGLAGQDPDRRAVFVSALEQSEQFFSAASAVGTQTRALLLFYGLAQSGRALRAAQQEGELWARAGNHGLTVLGGSTEGAFAAVRLRDTKSKPSDAFGWASATLNRSSLPDEISVGELTRLLFPYARFPLDGVDPLFPTLTLSAIRSDSYTAVSSTGQRGLRADLTVPASWEWQLPEPKIRSTADYDAYRAHIRAQLAHYPTISGAELFEPAPNHFQLKSVSSMERKVELVWPDLPPWDGAAEGVLHPFSDDNSAHVKVWPTLPKSMVQGSGADSLATHPFLLWWAVLYAAAHFIRYEPVRWARLVDVDESEEAVALEEISDVAREAVPELIHRVLVRTEPQ